MAITTLLIALGFAAIHLWIGRLPVVSALPRSVWLSMAGGIAVAYIFLHILPDLAAHRHSFARALRLDEGLAETLVFAVALAGLTALFGLERLVAAAQPQAAPSRRASSGRIWGPLPPTTS